MLIKKELSGIILTTCDNIHSIQILTICLILFFHKPLLATILNKFLNRSIKLSLRLGVSLSTWVYSSEQSESLLLLVSIGCGDVDWLTVTRWDAEWVTVGRGISERPGVGARGGIGTDFRNLLFLRDVATFIAFSSTFVNSSDINLPPRLHSLWPWHWGTGSWSVNGTSWREGLGDRYLSCVGEGGAYIVRAILYVQLNSHINSLILLSFLKIGHTLWRAIWFPLQLTHRNVVVSQFSWFLVHFGHTIFFDGHNKRVCPNFQHREHWVTGKM